MLKLVESEPVNDTDTYYRLDENLQPAPCNEAEWKAFQDSGAANVATTSLGEFGSVTTTFDGINDGFDDDDPHTFSTLVMIPCLEFSEVESHRTWHEAEAAHRERVDEMKARLDRHKREREPQLEL